MGVVYVPVLDVHGVGRQGLPPLGDLSTHKVLVLRELAGRARCADGSGPALLRGKRGGVCVSCGAAGLFQGERTVVKCGT